MGMGMAGELQATETAEGVLVKRKGFDGKERELRIAGLALATFEAGRKAWESGVLIQDAFPMLSADQREFLLTGITPDEWNAMFGDEEGEE